MISAQQSIHDCKLADMSDLPLYPIHYFQRGKVCDLDWIIVRMRHVPKNKQQEVCDKYHELFFQKDGRKRANEYLHGVASEYRLKRGKV